MLPSKIQNPLKFALPYLKKWCLKSYLGRKQSFGKGFRVQFSILSEIGFEISKFQPSVAYKGVAYKEESV